MFGLFGETGGAVVFCGELCGLVFSFEATRGAFGSTSVTPEDAPMLS